MCRELLGAHVPLESCGWLSFYFVTSVNMGSPSGPSGLCSLQMFLLLVASFFANRGVLVLCSCISLGEQVFYREDHEFIFIANSLLSETP